MGKNMLVAWVGETEIRATVAQEELLVVEGGDGQNILQASHRYRIDKQHLSSTFPYIHPLKSSMFNSVTSPTHFSPKYIF